MRFLTLLFFFLPVFAHASPVFPSTTSGNTTTYSEGSYSNATMAGAALATAGAGVMAVNYATEIRTAAGAVFPIIARALPTPAAVAGAVRFCFGNPACYVATAAAAAIAANEIGFQLSTDPSTGLPKVQKPDPTACTTAPCYGYYSIFSAEVFPTEVAAAKAGCTVMASRYGLTSPRVGSLLGYSGSTAVYQCFMKDGSSEAQFSVNVDKKTVPPSAAAAQDATLEDLIKGIEFPASGASTASDKWSEVVKGAASRGYDVPLSRPTAIDVPKPTVTSTPTVSSLGGGKTQTTTQSTTLTCNPPQCAGITTTTTQIADTGVGTTTTTTTEEPADVVQDTPFADVPTLYKTKYPDGLTGVWNTQYAAIKASKVGSLLTMLTPTFSSGGSCPKFALSLDVAIANFGSADVAPPCWLWPILKVFTIVGALFLARALIFGG